MAEASTGIPIGFLIVLRRGEVPLLLRLEIIPRSRPRDARSAALPSFWLAKQTRHIIAGTV
ncbi:MAG: hypothetical protein ACRECE_02360, partial [Xanthobacteraceae bacterium]